MKFFKRMTLLSITALSAGLALVGCKSNVKMPVTFVAVTSSEYNAAVSFGQYSYKFKGKVDQKSDKFTLEATVQVPEAKEGEEVSSVDWSSHNWSLDGTYTLTDGYGYVLQLNDAKKSVIHTDFIKTEGRHDFYYTVEIENVKSQVHFQAKDPAFKNSLAKDYKTWDQRDSKYIFYAKATGNNGSAATAYLYLHSDGSAKMDHPNSRSADRTVDTEFTWEEAGGVITLKKDQQQWNSIASINSAKPGYAIFHDDYTFICPTNSDVKWKKMELTDFKGESTHEFKGSYSTTGPDASTTELNLLLFASGSAGIYNAKSWKELGAGSWSEQEDLHISIGNEALVPYEEGGKTYVDYTVKVEETNPKGTQIREYAVKFEQTK